MYTNLVIKGLFCTFLGGMPMTMTSTPSSSQVQQQQAQQQQQQQPGQPQVPPQQQQQQPGGPGFGPGGPSAGPGASLQQQQQQNATTPQQTMSNTVQADKSESSNPTTGIKSGYLIRLLLELEIRIRLFEL